jgi:hypothetical protein
VIVVPDLGSVAWTCRAEAGEPPTFKTAFSAMNATEKVGFTIGAVPIVTKTLQPGQALSTPYTKATKHIWTVDQPTGPYVSTATITITLRPDPVYRCFNPSVKVTRERVSNATMST